MDITTLGASPSLLDNTDLIQKAIDTSAPGELVIIPQGVFKVDAVKGLQLKSGTNLRIDGTLQALPNDQPHSSVLVANGVHDIPITLNGQIIGERETHIGNTGEWGMGITISNSSNVSVWGTGTISKCWGDGIYIWEGHNIGVYLVTLDSNRRNNMSVISVDGLTVQNITSQNAGGTDPQSGLDLEPDYPTEFIKNVDISKNKFINNKGCGVMFGFGGAPRSNFSNVNVHDNTFSGGKPIGGVNTWYMNLLYAIFPNQYWMFPTSYKL